MLYRIVIIVVCMVGCARAVTTPKPAWPLQVKTVDVAPGVRKAYLEDQHGKPFFYNAGSHVFTPPGQNSFGDRDWVLVLEAQEDSLRYDVSWLGNSFPGADDEWVQNFFVHMNVRPDGSCVTWSHWDEGGKRFGIYKDGDVIGNEDVGANSLEVKDKQGRQWRLEVRYIDPNHNEWDFESERITCDGQDVRFPGSCQVSQRSPWSVFCQAAGRTRTDVASDRIHSRQAFYVCGRHVCQQFLEHLSVRR